MNNQQVGSICASFSDFCSLGQRVQSTRENLLAKQNSRLRKEYAQISQKYFMICNQMSKFKAKLIEKEKKITQLDLFYRKQIQQLKKQLILKSSQLSKYKKRQVKKSFCSNKQNSNQNINNEDYLQSCIENQSLALIQIQNQNNKLNIILSQLLEIFQPQITQQQNQFAYKRMIMLKKELNEKSTTNTLLQKANNILQNTKKGINQGEISNMFNTLKNKITQLKKTPITFDYSLESESKNMQILFTTLDVQLRLLQQKKSQLEL